MKGSIGPDGKYRRGAGKGRGWDVSSTHKEWRHELERKQYAREIIQPWVNGRPNPAFVRAYPDESLEYFTPDQIKTAEREL